jgi:hypothetical protein
MSQPKMMKMMELLTALFRLLGLVFLATACLLNVIVDGQDIIKGSTRPTKQQFIREHIVHGIIANTIRLVTNQLTRQGSRQININR